MTYEIYEVQRGKVTAVRNIAQIVNVKKPFLIKDSEQILSALNILEEYFGTSAERYYEEKKKLHQAERKSQRIKHLSMSTQEVLSLSKKAFGTSPFTVDQFIEKYCPNSNYMDVYNRFRSLVKQKSMDSCKMLGETKTGIFRAVKTFWVIV